MSASPADSVIYRQLFGDVETARFFSDSAEIRAMLLVEGALARVQGALGLIPPDAAAFIDRSSREVLIDPEALGLETARNGVPVPALLAAFRKSGGAPEMLQYLHWGATSQDIMDTALVLRLRPMLEVWEQRLDALLARLAQLAADHASQSMAARTYGQIATPTSFGAVVASWGWPMHGLRGQLGTVRKAVLKVSLSGGAGTLGAMGPSGPAVRAALALELGLADPGHSWHSDRSSLGQLASLAAGFAGAIGKLAEDLLALSQSGIAEVRSRSASGGSSTMPQKQNPVQASALVAMARHVIGLAGMLQGSALHRQQRDGAAWFGEWLSLPSLCISTGRLLSLANETLEDTTPDAAVMAFLLDNGFGLIHAEALTFALAERMPRPDAMAVVSDLCKEARATGVSLRDLAARVFPDVDWHAKLTSGNLGTASTDALNFAAMVRDVKS